jgi:hypothetical protein
MKTGYLNELTVPGYVPKCRVPVCIRLAILMLQSTMFSYVPFT